VVRVYQKFFAGFSWTPEHYGDVRVDPPRTVAGDHLATLGRETGTSQVPGEYERERVDEHDYRPGHHDISVPGHDKAGQAGDL